MTSGFVDARAKSKSAQAISSITRYTPQPSTTALSWMMDFFDLSKLKNAIIPFAYDASSWLAVSKKESGITNGALNNTYAPWSMLLYVLREQPQFLFDEHVTTYVGEQEFEEKKRRLNSVIKRIEQAKKNDKRLLEDDDVLFAASLWYMLANSADFSEGSILSESFELGNKFVGLQIGSPRIGIGIEKHMLEDMSARLEGAYFSDLDPTVHAMMYLQQEDRRFCKKDSLWVITPERNKQELEKANYIIENYLRIILDQGAKTLVVVPKSSFPSFAKVGRIGKDKSEVSDYGLRLYTSDEMPDQVLVTNLEISDGSI